MTEFNEIDHPRTGGGEFRAKTNDAPAGTLDTPAPRRLFAHVDEQGTALSVTALCTDCEAHAGESMFWDQDAVGERVDCTGNDALDCQRCGWAPA